MMQPSTDDRIETAVDLMSGFARGTGLTSAAPPRRDLWTDAFAVCNLLGLARATGDAAYIGLARSLVDQVHRTLARHRDDDDRRGWISGLGETDGVRVSLRRDRGLLAAARELDQHGRPREPGKASNASPGPSLRTCRNPQSTELPWSGAPTARRARGTRPAFRCRSGMAIASSRTAQPAIVAASATKRSEPVMLNVGKICSRDVDLAEADESVCQAAKRMLSRRVGTLVVVDAERRPKGIVTDRDLTLRVLATSKDPDTAWISEVFTTPVHSITEDATIDEAVRKMRVERCRRLVVLNDAAHVVGIISLDDVLALLAEQLHNVAALLESEAPHALRRRAAARLLNLFSPTRPGASLSEARPTRRSRHGFQRPPRRHRHRCARSASCLAP